MRALNTIIFTVGIAVVAALPKEERWIVGGTQTRIEWYPFVSALLRTADLINYHYSCVGAIINNRSILSAAHCFHGDTAARWRIRVGSNFADRGGVVHNTFSIINHPNYDSVFSENDVALLRSSSAFTFSANVSAVSIAGPNYNLGDYQFVYAFGWGTDLYDEESSDQLRLLDLYNIHLETCKFIYNELAATVTDNMICMGWFDFPNRDECLGNSGNPIIHEIQRPVVVGVTSWGMHCTHPRFPAVGTRIARYSSWIQNNA